MIEAFKDEYRFLSNFHPAEVEWEGCLYPTVEHAYQAAKTVIPEERAAVLACPHAGAAKKYSAKLTIRPDWEAIKPTVMRQLLRAKFSIPELRELLLATGEEEIIEGNSWHDTYWGQCYCERCRGEGQNLLGQMLMEIRAAL